MKKTAVFFIVVGIGILLFETTGFSAVNVEKMEKSKIKHLTKITELVSKNGKATVGPFAKKYDKNKDGVIDSQEVKAIRDYLN